MTVELWHATLNPAGPNYATWHAIFGDSKVPLKSPQPHLANLGDQANVEVYLLDLTALTLPQRAKLLSIVAQRFGVPIFEVEAEIAKRGFPIRGADLVVTIDLRAVV